MTDDDEVDEVDEWTVSDVRAAGVAFVRAALAGDDEAMCALAGTLAGVDLACAVAAVAIGFGEQLHGGRDDLDERLKRWQSQHLAHLMGGT